MTEIIQPSDSERFARITMAERLYYEMWLADTGRLMADGIIKGMETPINPDSRGGGGKIFHTINVDPDEWKNTREAMNRVLGRLLEKPTEEIAETEVLPLIGDEGTVAVDLRYWPLTPGLDLVKNARYGDSGGGTLSYSVGLGYDPQSE